MLPELKNSEVVSKSLQDYKHKSTFITNKDVQKELNNLILSLEEQVRDLEQAHRIRTAGSLKPSLFTANRQNIHNTRKRIISIFKENNIPI